MDIITQQKYKEIAEASLLSWLDYDLWAWMGNNFLDTQSLKENNLIFDRINLLKREYEKLYSLHASNLKSNTLSNLDCAIVELALKKCCITIGLDFSKVNMETFEAYEHKLYEIENQFLDMSKIFLKNDNPILIDILIAKKFTYWFNQNKDLILIPENFSDNNMEKSLGELKKLSCECLEILTPILKTMKFADYMKNQLKEDGFDINENQVKDYLNLYFNFWSMHFLSYKDMFHSIINSSKQKERLDAWEHLNILDEIYNRMLVIGIELSNKLLAIIDQKPLSTDFLSLSIDSADYYLKLENYKII